MFGVSPLSTIIWDKRSAWSLPVDLARTIPSENLICPCDSALLSLLYLTYTSSTLLGELDFETLED